MPRRIGCTDDSRCNFGRLADPEDITQYVRHGKTGDIGIARERGGRDGAYVGNQRHDRPQGEAMIPSMRDVFNHAMKGAIRILLSLFVPTLAFPALPQSSLSAGTRWLD